MSTVVVDSFGCRRGNIGPVKENWGDLGERATERDDVRGLVVLDDLSRARAKPSATLSPDQIELIVANCGGYVRARLTTVVDAITIVVMTQTDEPIPDTQPPGPLFAASTSGEYVRISAVDCSYMVSVDDALTLVSLGGDEMDSTSEGVVMDERPTRITALRPVRPMTLVPLRLPQPWPTTDDLDTWIPPNSEASR